MYFLIIAVVTFMSLLLLLRWSGNGGHRWAAEMRRRWGLRGLSREKHRKKLERDSCNAQDIQEKLLLRYLEQDRSTEYGLTHNFKDLPDASSFRKNHPLTQYVDYKDYLQRTSQGEENVLVPGRPCLLVATAGTSGNRTLLPIRSTEHFLQGAAVCLEIIHNAFPGALEKVFTFSFPPTVCRSDAGIPIIPYPSLFSTGFTKDICLPHIPLHPSMSHHDILYTQLLFSLRDPDLTMLQANFSRVLRHVFSILEDRWESLVADIQKGRLSPELAVPLETRKQIEDLLVPDASRAAELRSHFREGFRGVAKRMWPRLRVIVAVESGGSDLDRQVVKDGVCRGIPVYSPTYCAAEGLCGVNLWPGEDVARYVLCPRSVFCEFIPAEMSEREHPAAVSAGEVSADKAYELVISNGNGLYRYRLGDVVQVTGFHNQSPIVKFLYRWALDFVGRNIGGREYSGPHPVHSGCSLRKSQTLNVRGERISECGFYKTLRCAVDVWPGAALLEYCCMESGVLGPFSGGSDPHYEVFVALKGVRNLSEDQRYKLCCPRSDEKSRALEMRPLLHFGSRGRFGTLRFHPESIAVSITAKLPKAAVGCLAIRWALDFVDRNKEANDIFRSAPDPHRIFPCIRLDQTLQEHFPVYKSFRFKGSIGPVRVHLTSPKSFLSLLEMAAKLWGLPLDCVQPPRTLNNRAMAEMIWRQVLS